MKFNIEAVWRNGEDTVKEYSEKAKPFEIKLEEIEHSTYYGVKHLIKIATIELNSLEDLRLLCSNVGYPLVFNASDADPEINLPSLEIYDDYRE